MISEELQEVLLLFPQINDISPQAQIEDISIIKEIVAKCGYKIRIVGNPLKEEAEVVEIVRKNIIFLFVNKIEIFC